MKTVHEKSNHEGAYSKSVPTTYLVIGTPFLSDEKFVDRVLAAIPKQDTVAAPVDHHVWSHANRYPECDTLVNLACKSGLSGPYEYEERFGLVVQHSSSLGPRNWAEDVSFRDKRLFRWGHPFAEHLIHRHGRVSQTQDGEKTPEDCKHRWAHLQCYHAQPPDYGVALEQVRAVAIFLNGSCERGAIEVFKTLAKRHGLWRSACARGVWSIQYE
jgi:hypothetical protein